ncbi:MAG: globin domain-containing protein [Allosphingosinicella sp.]
MTIQLSERTRVLVAKSLPLMEQHRPALEEALERRLAQQGAGDPSAPRTTTGAIADMLFDHARQPGGQRAPAATGATAQRHRALAIGSEHYSALGDALKPIMKDVLGAKATPLVLAAWGDAYWTIVRAMSAQRTRLAA